MCASTAAAAVGVAAESAAEAAAAAVIPVWVQEVGAAAPSDWARETEAAVAGLVGRPVTVDSPS